MSIYLTKPEPAETPIPAVRTNTAKRTLLKDKVAAMLAPIADTKVAIQNGSELDIFAMAVAVNGDIDKGVIIGLVRGDFDGTDITEIVSELLATP